MPQGKINLQRATKYYTNILEGAWEIPHFFSVTEQFVYVWPSHHPQPSFFNSLYQKW